MGSKERRTNFRTYMKNILCGLRMRRATVPNKTLENYLKKNVYIYIYITKTVRSTICTSGDTG